MPDGGVVSRIGVRRGRTGGAGRLAAGGGPGSSSRTPATGSDSGSSASSSGSSSGRSGAPCCASRVDSVRHHVEPIVVEPSSSTRRRRSVVVDSSSIVVDCSSSDQAGAPSASPAIEPEPAARGRSASRRAARASGADRMRPGRLPRRPAWRSRASPGPPATATATSRGRRRCGPMPPRSTSNAVPTPKLGRDATGRPSISRWMRGSYGIARCSTPGSSRSPTGELLVDTEHRRRGVRQVGLHQHVGPGETRRRGGGPGQLRADRDPRLVLEHLERGWAWHRGDVELVRERLQEPLGYRERIGGRGHTPSVSGMTTYRMPSGASRRPARNVAPWLTRSSASSTALVGCGRARRRTDR